ncbi:neutral zinc metallopeptidase [Actinomadura viridis]|uniref:Metalloprotease n=1 Tax=Actinomadura viridis TaxID=58110 RepID=A0A931DLA8_9ACTN|nr:neutral zinc metallopeptidase [Actinomadura viridis]MBG6093314.1 putative metalloprotease [Actinomadura viridis]
MAGRHPPPAPAPAVVHDPPDGPRRAVYRYEPRRRPPRRAVDVTAAGVLGGLAGLAVLVVLGLATFGGVGGGRMTASGLRAGDTVSSETATANRLYATGPLTPVRCRLPRIDPGADSMRGFMDRLSDCLDGAWKGQFGKARMAYAPPNRVFWDAPGRSPCGTYPSPGASAFYCPANNTMYVGLDHIIETSGREPLSNFAVFARVIAHEYGHHVQERAGILLYGQQRMERSRDVPARTETSRRIELQAQCFAGAFLGAERRTLPMTRQQYEALMADVRGRGDDRQPAEKRDHGSGDNYAGWVAKGYRDQRLAACNTWTVSPAEVG